MAGARGRVATPLLIAGLFAAALALRLATLAELSAGPFSPSVYLPIDAASYHRWAIDWLQGNWPPPMAFFRPPLYTVFVGAVYALAGPHAPLVLAVQAVLGAGSCLLVFALARQLFPGHAVAWVAAVACALLGPLIYFDAQLLSASLETFLLLSLLVALLAAARSGRTGPWLAAGLALGLSAINRGGVLLLAPLLLLWLWRLPAWRAEPAAGRPARRGRAAAALFVPALFAILPVALHNARYDRDDQPAQGAREIAGRILSGRFLLIAGSSGINFYLGNHAALQELNSLEHPDHMAVYDRIRTEATRVGHRSESTRNRYFVRQTLRHMLAWPRESLGLLASKSFQLLNGAEIPRNTSIYADRRQSRVLRWLLWKWGVAFPSGLVIPLGLVGLGLARHRWREHFPVLAALASHAAFVVAFFVTSRYRLPMLPLLAIYAAHAGVTLAGRLRGGQWRSAARPAAAAAVLVAICNLGIGPMEQRRTATELHNLGVTHYERGELAEAERSLRRALRRNPDAANSALALCRTLFDLQRPDEALVQCSRSLALEELAATHFLLGQVLERLGRRAESALHYERTRQMHPQAEGQVRAALERLRAAEPAPAPRLPHPADPP